MDFFKRQINKNPDFIYLCKIIGLFCIATELNLFRIDLWSMHQNAYQTIWEGKIYTPGFMLQSILLWMY